MAARAASPAPPRAANDCPADDTRSNTTAETVTDKKTDEAKKVEKVQERTSILLMLAGIPTKFVDFVNTVIHLFCQRRFGLHRFCGFFYLVQFALAVAGEFYPVIREEWFPHLHLTMPFTGCLQAVIATMTFKFLGKNAQVQGYFSDKRTMSYDFVFENVFFAGLLLFQATYFYQKWIFVACPPLEALCVFFPYFTIRKAFPRTRLRDSLSADKERSDKNKRFLYLQTWTTKVFMMFGKHVSGFLCNYLIFLDAIPGHHVRTMRLQFILGGWGTTIAMFLHTLKFKGYLGPRTAMLSYTLVFPLFYCVYVALGDILLQQISITAIAIGGLAVNFLPVPFQVAWQLCAYGYLRHLRQSTDLLSSGAMGGANSTVLNGSA